LSVSGPGRFSPREQSTEQEAERSQTFDCAPLRLPETEPRFLGRPICILAAIPTETLRFSLREPIITIIRDWILITAVRIVEVDSMLQDMTHD
jgi:hypothetical protein